MDSLDMTRLDFYSNSQQVTNCSLTCPRNTTIENEMWWESVTTAVVTKESVVMTMACVVGLVANTLVVCVLAASKNELSLAARYIVNRAAADILFLVTVPYDSRAHLHNSWVFGSLLCKLRSALVLIGPVMSSVFLVALSGSWYVDTCMAGVSAKLRSTLVNVVSTVSWFTILLFSIPTFLQSEVFKEVLQERFHCVSLPLSEDALLSQLLRFLIIILVFVAPLVMCWVLMSLVIPAHTSRPCTPPEHSTSHMTTDESVRHYRLLLSLLVTFTACQLPYWLVYLVNEFIRGVKLGEAVMLAFSATLCLPSVNAALNPLLCIYYLQDLRRCETKAKTTQEQPQLIALVAL